MKLICAECHAVTELDSVAQEKILAELTLPAAAKIIECKCGENQFILAARKRRTE